MRKDRFVVGMIDRDAYESYIHGADKENMLPLTLDKAVEAMKPGEIVLELVEIPRSLLGPVKEGK